MVHCLRKTGQDEGGHCTSFHLCPISKASLGTLWGASLEGVCKNPPPPLLAPFLHVYPSHTTLCG